LKAEERCLVPVPPTPQTRAYGRTQHLFKRRNFANIPLLYKRRLWFRSWEIKMHWNKMFLFNWLNLHPGLIEVPMGITLREVVFDIAAGSNGQKIQSRARSGPCRGCLPDPCSSFHSLCLVNKSGRYHGLRRIVVLTKNPVWLTQQNLTEFWVEESCGKCTPCRAGLARVKEIFDGITWAAGKMEDISTLEKSGVFIKMQVFVVWDKQHPTQF